MFQLYEDFADCQSGENPILAKDVSAEQFDADVRVAMAELEKNPPSVMFSVGPNTMADYLIKNNGYTRVTVHGFNLTGHL